MTASPDDPVAPRENPSASPPDTEPGATDGEIFLVIQNGAAPEMKMKGLKGRMSDNDMWNVVNYLRSVGPKKK